MESSEIPLWDQTRSQSRAQVPSTCARLSPGVAVRAQQLVGRRRRVRLAGDHLDPRGVQRLAVSGQVGPDHGAGGAGEADVPDESSS